MIVKNENEIQCIIHKRVSPWLSLDHPWWLMSMTNLSEVVFPSSLHCIDFPHF